ncbi:hypothetical protein [Lactococcus sp.]|uniref:hypothetical protein n=1 Tax=Lactococcus sp. TaxID=44273 RepID=UPI0035B3A1CB
MKALGKALANKVATIIIVVLVLVIGFFVVKSYFKGLNPFSGTTSAEYTTVVNKFSQKSELVVAGAESDTTTKQTFKNNAMKDWPSWSQPITSFFVSRNLIVEIPVKTEFKISLQGITENDVSIKDNVLTFKTPLTVNVTSQQNGTITTVKTGAGLVDRVVDAVTAGSEAQKFFSEKTQETVASTTNTVMNDKDRQEKVRQYAQEDLENLLNLKSGEKLTVKLQASDLKFVNSDK